MRRSSGGILFDAIEISVKDFSPLATMIQDLYGGTLQDYLKCLQCGNESCREDSFLDLSLTVRSESDDLYNHSVEKAIASYLTPELLHDENQVFCEKCNQKQDAMKGFKLKSLPYILMLQLKRFDLDLIMMQRRKLNDSVTFPEVLNMNPFFTTPCEVPKSESQTFESDCVSLPQGSPEFLESMKLCYRLVPHPECIISDPDCGSLRMDDVALRRFREKKAVERHAKTLARIEDFQQEGEHVYELFSVMVHSGSSLGGHYYAYIKSLENYRWYDFDDSHVKEIDDDELERAFGGENTLYGTSAYLLMYRKVSPTNISCVSSSAIPAEVCLQVEKEAMAQSSEPPLCFCLYQDKTTQLLDASRTSTCEDLKLKAMEAVHMTADPDSMRLWLYDHRYEAFLEPLDNPNLVLENLPQTSDCPGLRLLPRRSDDDVDTFDRKLIYLPLYVRKESGTEPKMEQLIITAERCEDVQRLVRRVGEKTKIPEDRLVVYRFFCRWRKLERISSLEYEGKTLLHAGIFDGASLFADDISLPRSPQESPFRIVVRYFPPTSDPDSDPDSGHSLFLEKRSSTSFLRSEIARSLMLDSANTILRKGHRHGYEIKDEVELWEVTRHAGISVFVETGTPATAGEWRIQLDFVEVTTEPDPQWFAFTPIGSVLIGRSETVAALKQKLLSHEFISSRFLTLDDFCLRERLGDHLGALFPPSSIASLCVRTERKRVAVQVHYPQISMLPHAMSVSFRVWDPSDYQLSSAREVWVDALVSGEGLGRLIAKSVHIPLARLEVTRITFLGGFSRLSLWKARWCSLDSKHAPVTGFPLFLANKGCYLVVKDAAKEVSPPTDREVRQYAVRTLPRVLEPLHSRFREKSMKITVKKEKSN